jgi:hypothetical protein
MIFNASSNAEAFPISFCYRTSLPRAPIYNKFPTILPRAQEFLQHLRRKAPKQLFIKINFLN